MQNESGKQGQKQGQDRSSYLVHEKMLLKFAEIVERIRNVKIAAIVPIVSNPISGRPIISTRLRRPASACIAFSQLKATYFYNLLHSPSTVIRPSKQRHPHFHLAK
jgi:hypothetical protein